MTEKPPTPISNDVPVLLDRPFLIRRWQKGSDAFFWRQEKLGKLCVVSDGTKRRYTWDAAGALAAPTALCLPKSRCGTKHGS